MRPQSTLLYLQKNSKMDISKRNYGNLPDGREVSLYTLDNGLGMEVDIANYGGIVTAIRIPDKNHEPGDVVLGFDKLEGYLEEHPYFGAIIGRVGNRIDKGRFELEGVEYKLAVNQAPSHLHGGIQGFDKVLWTAATEKKPDRVALKLGYESPHMEEGYPGNLLVEVEYLLNEKNDLVISYRATTDQTTHVNLTNHSYFNLNNCQGSILDHELMIDADHVTRLNEDQIPDGSIIPVENTPFDFRIAKKIGEEIEEVAPGYDINYVVNNYTGDLLRIASVHHEGSGRSMEVFTKEPGVQLYTANYVENIIGKSGIDYQMHSALCLETQHFPDSPNNPDFPSTVLKAGEEYSSATIYRFKW